MQSRLAMRWLVGSILCGVTAAAACSAGEAGEISSVTPDGSPAAFTGLTLDFIADTELPALVGGGGGDAEVRIDDVYLNGSVIRAVGDASTQDEQATMRHDHALYWDRDDAPGELAFSAAPVGEYSYIELRIAGRPYADRTEAFEVTGEVRREGEDGWTDFEIRADAPTVVANVPASMRLEAGRPLTIRIELGVGELVRGIDWAALPEREGTLRLDEQTPAALASFCDALGRAFRAR